MLGGLVFYFIFILPSVPRSAVKMSVNQLIKNILIKRSYLNFAKCEPLLE